MLPSATIWCFRENFSKRNPVPAGHAPDFRLKRLALAVAFACLSTSLMLTAQQAKSATYDWNAATGDWFTSTNWDPNGIPSAGDTAIIRNDGTAEIKAGDSATIRELYIGHDGKNGSLSINGNLALIDLFSLGIDSNSSGTVTVHGTSSVFSDSTIIGHEGLGTLTVTDGGQMTLSSVRLANHAGSMGRINLEGTAGSRGILEATYISVGDGTGEINLDGGILRALQNEGDFLRNFGANGVTINAGGAFFDTNGFDVTVSAVIGGTGALTKQGMGTLVLTGDNTYTGDTTISAGELVFDSGTSIIGGIRAGGGNLVIQNGARVDSDASFIGIDGLGSAIATVSGSTWNTSGDLKVSDRLGGMFIGVGGTLRVENGGQVNSGGELFLDIGGMLEIDSSSQVTAVNGLRVLAGRIRALSDGQLDIPDITVQVGFDFDTNGFNASYAGSMTGAGGVGKRGAGTLTLTGNNADSTLSATVFEGTLAVNGTFAGNVQVNGNGALGGSGTVGSVTINGGTLAPGNSIGTLNVAGDVNFGAGGVYEVEVDAAGNSDLIIATGTANLTNGSVHVLPAAGNYNRITDYTILKAAGGLGGTTFNSVDSNLAFLTPTLSYDANNVFLRLERNDVSFAAIAGTPNQVAVGTAINILSNTTPGSIQEVLDNLSILTTDGANRAYDSLSGVQYTHGNLVALQSASQFRNILFDRFNGSNQFLAHDGRIMLAHNHMDTMADTGNQLLSGGVHPQRGWWIRGTGNFGDIDDSRNASGADYKAGGIVAGIDFDFGDRLTAGAAIGYTRTDVDVAGGGIDVDSYQAALYGRFGFGGGYYVSGLAGMGYHDMDARRNVSVGLLNTSAKADYHAWTGTFAIEGGRNLSFDRTSLTPFLGLEYAHMNRESFTEKGPTAVNLKVSEDNQDSLRSALGIRVTHEWITSKGYRITPTAELAWVHEFLEDEASLRAGFASAPAVTFSVDGPDLDRDRARVALGLSLQFRETAFFHLGYQGEFASSDRRHDLAATLRVMW